MRQREKCATVEIVFGKNIRQVDWPRGEKKWKGVSRGREGKHLQSVKHSHGKTTGSSQQSAGCRAQQQLQYQLQQQQQQQQLQQQQHFDSSCRNCNFISLFDQQIFPTIFPPNVRLAKCDIREGRRKSSPF